MSRFLNRDSSSFQYVRQPTCVFRPYRYLTRPCATGAGWELRSPQHRLRGAHDIRFQERYSFGGDVLLQSSEALKKTLIG